MAEYAKVNHFNQYKHPTVELVLELLYSAYEDEIVIDRALQDTADQAMTELVEEIKRLAADGKIELDEKIDLENNPALLGVLKNLEEKQRQKLVEFYWLGEQAMTNSLIRSHKKTLSTTYDIFGYNKGKNPYDFLTPKSGKNQKVNTRVVDNYIKENILNIPWCQDGKLYSERLYGHVKNFHDKLGFILEEGISKGKGIEWMIESWKKLTGSTAYNAARLLKTETMAMWSRTTKSAYITMGIQYVEIVGDAACGGVCVDYVGEAVPLAEAELGDLLPPYHPNCACSYVAYTEEVEVPIEEYQDNFEGETE